MKRNLFTHNLHNLFTHNLKLSKKTVAKAPSGVVLTRKELCARAHPRTDRDSAHGAQDCGVKAFAASSNLARLACQARRGEVSVSSYGWAPSGVFIWATSSSTCSLPAPGRA